VASSAVDLFAVASSRFRIPSASRRRIDVPR
jgi:hypothetical protein